MGGPPPRHFPDDREDPRNDFDRENGGAAPAVERSGNVDDRGPPHRRGPAPDRRPQDPRPNRPPEARWTLWQHTIDKILLLLTPEQRDKWHDLTGEPLPYDLRMRLDE
jgi:hypothetical protein